MTQGEATSQLINTIRSLNKDQHISKRYALSLLRENAKTLISQKLLDRTISQEYNLYSTIPCFEFEQVDVKKCPQIEFRMCSTIMRSKKKLPEVVYSRLGAAIRSVLSIDGNISFTIADSKQYLRNKSRMFSNDDPIIYVGSDLHLYIPDREILAIDLELLTVKTDETEECSCKKNECKSGWDYEFIVPDKLIQAVFDKTLQTLGFSKQMRVDVNPNTVEGA